jgi:hypothetical protein
MAISYRRLVSRLRTSQAAPEEIMAEVRRIAAAIGCRRAVVMVAFAGLLISSLPAGVRLMPAKQEAKAAPSQIFPSPAAIATSAGTALSTDRAPSPIISTPLPSYPSTADGKAPTVGTQTTAKRIPQPGTITTVVNFGLPENGSLATNASINYPGSIALDGAGGFYISSFSDQDNRIRKVFSPSR